MFNKCRIDNSLNSSLNIITCQSRGLVIDLNEHEQEIISGSGGRDDAWTWEVKGKEKHKHWLASNFKVNLRNL